MPLRYITLDDLPLDGPDPYSDAAKQRAGEAAEQKLEADVNDGRSFDDTTALHDEAIAAWATYRLSSGTVHPTDAQSGYGQGGAGDDQMEFASEMRRLYESDVQSILGSTADESSDDGDFTLSA